MPAQQTAPPWRTLGVGVDFAGDDDLFGAGLQYSALRTERQTVSNQHLTIYKTKQHDNTMFALLAVREKNIIWTI